MTAISDLLTWGFTIVCICGGVLVLGVILALGTEKAIKDMPYVGPVADQIKALPADEILVRASDQPAPTPEQLLRAAQVGSAQPAEELLRAESKIE